MNALLVRKFANDTADKWRLDAPREAEFLSVTFLEYAFHASGGLYS